MRYHPLAVIVFLLTLSVHVSAQNRGSNEALEGLGDIGLIVKYHKAEGLSEVMRPTMLQMLQDRARDTLRYAGISLLDTTDEAEMAGKPRLVFTVTLNAPSETAPAIRVETRFYERVRLWRDRAKQLELATWVRDGIGTPKVTYKVLFDVFDQQVNLFIKAYKEVNPDAQQVGNRVPDPPTQRRDTGNPLEGLNGVSLFVAGGPASAGAKLEPLLKTLRIEAEKKLTQAGIPVLKYVNETKVAGDPTLYLYLKLGKRNSADPEIGITSDFWQQVHPVRDPKKTTRAVTWESYGSDNGPISEEAVFQVMNAQLDEFIKAYIAANPRVSAIPK